MKTAVLLVALGVVDVVGDLRAVEVVGREDLDVLDAGGVAHLLDEVAIVVRDAMFADAHLDLGQGCHGRLGVVDHLQPAVLLRFAHAAERRGQLHPVVGLQASLLGQVLRRENAYLVVDVVERGDEARLRALLERQIRRRAPHGSDVLHDDRQIDPELRKHVAAVVRAPAIRDATHHSVVPRPIRRIELRGEVETEAGPPLVDVADVVDVRQRMEAIALEEDRHAVPSALPRRLHASNADGVGGL
jgi:hypothetical protein